MASSASDDAELASVTATLEDLHRRIGSMAARYDTGPSPREDVISALYEAERSLTTAVRTVTKARRAIG